MSAWSICRLTGWPISILCSATREAWRFERLATLLKRTARGAAVRQCRSGDSPAGRSRCPSSRPTLSYLGTYAEDRQETLERLFIEPARLAGSTRFVIGGAQYPADFPWTQQHLLRPASSAGAAPGVLLFVAHDTERHAPSDGGDGLLPVGTPVRSCGVRQSPILSDAWEGLDEFYHAGCGDPAVPHTGTMCLDALRDAATRS